LPYSAFVSADPGALSPVTPKTNHKLNFGVCAGAHAWRIIAMKRSQRWIQLCQAVLDEKDPDRLMDLVSELNNVLEQQEIGNRCDPGITPEARGS
jgi:hypothetical protein